MKVLTEASCSDLARQYDRQGDYVFGANANSGNPRIPAIGAESGSLHDVQLYFLIEKSIFWWASLSSSPVQA